jgi:hypothetical protein
MNAQIVTNVVVHYAKEVGVDFLNEIKVIAFSKLLKGYW